MRMQVASHYGAARVRNILRHMGRSETERETRDWGRRMRRWALLYLVIAIIAGWAYAAGRYEIFPSAHLQKLTRAATFVSRELRGNGRISILDRLRLHRLEQPRSFNYTGFHLRDPAFRDDGFLLLSRYSKDDDQSVIELVRIDGFIVMHRWVPPIDEILSRGRRDKEWNSRARYRAYHPLLLEDGSVVFHSGAGPLVRLDSRGQIVWLLDGIYHHSIEQDHNGDLVVPLTLDWDSRAIEPAIREDAYAVVTPSGTLKETHSLTPMFLDNGYRALVMGVGKFELDRYHLNDAEPILHDRGAARRGDVALSLRHLSTVLLYRPSTRKIVWLETGPWLNQHDVTFLDDGRFSVFGNDMYRIDYSTLPRRKDRLGFLRAGDHSEIYILDPESGRTETPYAPVLKEISVYSSVEGRAMILANGDAFVEQNVGHRLLRVSANAVRWEYVNGTGEKTSGALNWCRYIPKDEATLDWRAR